MKYKGKKRGHTKKAKVFATVFGYSGVLFSGGEIV